MKLCGHCGTRFTEAVAFCPHDGMPTQDLAVTPPPDPLLGRVIDGRYCVERTLGKGGCGVVYLVRHAVLGKRLALKVLRGDRAQDADALQRFIQEAQSATSIGHPNIIDISDFGKLADGSFYFVMEYLDGDPLSKVIARGGSIPMGMALHVIRQIASALGAAHARDIVHRDLKPDNIYLIRRGQDESFVKVLDFGIAKVGGASSKLTRTGMIFGTPHYMSPEQASGQSVDHRTDVYALGVIMYEMFTGTVPFDGDTFMGILAKHMFEPPHPPSQVKGQNLGPIEDVIMKALSKRPEDRYQSMSELIADLDRIAVGASPELAARRGPASVPGDFAPALEPPSHTELRPSAARPADDTIVSVPKKRLPTSAVVAAVIGVLGMVAGGVVLWISGSSPGGQAGGAPADMTASGGQAGGAPADMTASGGQAGGASSGGTAGAIATGASDGIGAGSAGASVGADVGPRPATARTVEIVSEPPGAEVTIDGALVGYSPVQLALPREGERVVQVRMRGYESAHVMLNAATPPSIRVSLTRAGTETRAGANAGGGRPARGRGTKNTLTSTPATETGATTHTRLRSEVLDPWAD
jgi:serine/threonine-protein kinase